MYWLHTVHVMVLLQICLGQVLYIEHVQMFLMYNMISYKCKLTNNMSKYILMSDSYFYSSSYNSTSNQFLQVSEVETLMLDIHVFHKHRSWYLPLYMHACLRESWHNVFFIYFQSIWKKYISGIPYIFLATNRYNIS